MQKVGRKSSRLTSSQGCLPQIPEPHFFKSLALAPHPALGARSSGTAGVKTWRRISGCSTTEGRMPRCTEFFWGGCPPHPPPHSRLSSPVFPEQGTVLLFSTERDTHSPAGRRIPLLWVKEELWALEGPAVLCISLHRKGGSWWVTKTTQKPASLPEVQNSSAGATRTRYKGDKVTHIFQIKKPRRSKGEPTPIHRARYFWNEWKDSSYLRDH